MHTAYAFIKTDTRRNASGCGTGDHRSGGVVHALGVLQTPYGTDDTPGASVTGRS
jgi:hypothetical protein